jgi:AcrR family transcriptional regulator
MPRTALSQDRIDAFREALCEAATRLFAEHGYRGVTMRALAKDLGCSAMTPYRYFENKAAIFDTVRMASADRFADAIEAAARAHDDHAEKLRAMCHAYVDFALAEPHAYRIVFELDRSQRPESVRVEEARGWFVMKAAVAEAIADDVLEGDPEVVAHLLWSGIHGLVALHLAGMLTFGVDLASLVEAFIDRELPPTGFHADRTVGVARRISS